MRMQQYQHRRLHRQKGVAAIWMGLLLVPIMGVTFLAVEGTRYVQESSRLRDSAEAAALAVTIEDKEGAARALATKYVENYVRDIKSTDLYAQRFYQAEDKGIGALEYIQYTVDAKTTHDSWFSSHFIPSFDKQQTLAGLSVARKYPAYLGNNIDIVFVSDFSGSMEGRWGPNNHKKIDDLKNAIARISERILCNNIDKEFIDGELKDVCKDSGDEATGDKLLNRVGFVPFNVRTREILDKNGKILTENRPIRGGDQAIATSQLSYKSAHNADLSPYNYNDINWDYWRQYSRSNVFKCAKTKSRCPKPKLQNQRYAKRIKDVLREKKQSNNFKEKNYPDSYEYVDFASSISMMFTDKSTLKSNFFKVNNAKLFKGYGFEESSQFYNIYLSSKLSDLESIKSMKADGLTAVFQGIMRGFQVLHEGAPKRANKKEQHAYDKKIKMLLVLSDGKEKPKNQIFETLVDNGMCDKARKSLPGLYIGVIGIGFDASQQDGFKNCVIDPKEDIIDVSNLDALTTKIEQLIQKGSKTSGTTKLY